MKRAQENFNCVEFIATCMWCDFLDVVEQLVCSSFSFLDNLLMVSFHRYLQSVSKMPGSQVGVLHILHARGV